MSATTDHARVKGQPTPSPESWTVRLMAVVGAVLAVSLVLLGVYLNPGLRPAAGGELAIWMVATAAAAFATVSLGSTRPALSMDLPVLLACSFVLGPIPAGAVALVAATTQAELRGRIALSKAVWNHSQTSLSVLAAGFTFVWLGGEVGQWPVSLAAAIAAIVADTAVNYASVALFSSVSNRRALRDVVKEMYIGSPGAFAAHYLCFALTGLLIAEAYAAVGPVSLVAAVAPVALARQVFLNSHRLERISLQLRRRGAALMRVDERIADERRDERNRISEALHDDVLQALYTVTLHAHVIRQDYRSGRLLDLEKDVPAVVETAEKAAALLREVIFGLRQSPVGHAGLVETASLFVAHVHDETGIDISSDIDSSVRADPAVELLIYQVLREALTNVARHSGADKAWVDLRSTDGLVSLTVSDNGKGFDPERDRDVRHFGLDLMGERAEATGGSIEVRTSPGGGTHVEAWFKPRL